MKKLLYFTLLLLPLLWVSCGKKYSQDAAGMEQIGADLKEKFGEVYYTNISYSRSLDNPNIYVVSADQTQDPNSLTQERWLLEDNNWQKTATVNIDIKNGETKDYLFQPGRNGVSLAKLGELIVTSKDSLQKTQSAEGLQLKIAVVATKSIAMAGDRFFYTVIWEDKSGKTYSFTYNLKGELTNSNL